MLPHSVSIGDFNHIDETKDFFFHVRPVPEKGSPSANPSSSQIHSVHTVVHLQLHLPLTFGTAALTVML